MYINIILLVMGYFIGSKSRVRVAYSHPGLICIRSSEYLSIPTINMEKRREEKCRGPHLAS